MNEPIKRERMPADDKPWPFTRIEREGLLMLATRYKELSPDDLPPHNPPPRSNIAAPPEQPVPPRRSLLVRVLAHLLK